MSRHRGKFCAESCALPHVHQGPKKQNKNAGYNMHSTLKLVSYVIVLLVIVAILYAGYTSVKYWSGIGV